MRECYSHLLGKSIHAFWLLIVLSGSRSIEEPLLLTVRMFLQGCCAESLCFHLNSAWVNEMSAFFSSSSLVLSVVFRLDARNRWFHWENLQKNPGCVLNRDLLWVSHIITLMIQAYTSWSVCFNMETSAVAHLLRTPGFSALEDVLYTAVFVCYVVLMYTPLQGLSARLYL